jgi:hypothetical protein
MSKRAKLRKLERQLNKLNKKKKTLKKNNKSNMINTKINNKNVITTNNNNDNNENVIIANNNNDVIENNENIVTIDNNENIIKNDNLDSLIYIKILSLSLFQYLIFGFGVNIGYDFTMINMILNLFSIFLYRCNNLDDNILKRVINLSGILNFVFSYILKGSYLDIILIFIYFLADVIFCNDINFTPNILSIIPNNIIGYLLRSLFQSNIKISCLRLMEILKNKFKIDILKYFD